jgi:hypothetical protein
MGEILFLQNTGVHYDRKANRVHSVQYASVVQQPKRASVYNTSVNINIYIMKVRHIGVTAMNYMITLSDIIEASLAVGMKSTL